MIKTTCYVGKSVLRMYLRNFCIPVDGALCHCSSCCVITLFLKETKIFLWAWSSSSHCHEVKETTRVWETNFVFSVPLMSPTSPLIFLFSSALPFPRLLFFLFFPFRGCRVQKEKEERKWVFVVLGSNTVPVSYAQKSGCGNVLCKLCLRI